MKKQLVRFLGIILGLLVIAVPGVLIGQKIRNFMAQPSKTLYSESVDGQMADADFPFGADDESRKEEYLQGRDDQIALMRGLPFPEPDVRVKAVREMESQEESLRRNGLIPEIANWSYRGPSPIPVSVPTSGRVSAIAVDPTDPNIVYVGAAQGGLYRTINGGATWTPLLDNALSLAIGAVAIAPSDPTIVYVGTGEAGLSGDSFFGVGIYRITNADTAPVISGPLRLDTIGNDIFTGRSISEILVHPTDANIIFASTATGTCGLGGCTGQPQPSLGIYRSTNALAANPTFTKLSVNAANNAVIDMVMEPGVPDNLICWVRGAIGAGGGGVYRSTNALAATPTFTQTYAAVTNNSRGELAIQKTGATVTVVAATGEITGGATQGAVFKSTDGGLTFPTQLTAGNNFCNPQCFYDIAIAFDPNDALKLYIGGSPTAVFRRSFDGGSTFASSASGLHVDTHAITVAPSNPQIIYFGSDGGIYRSVNGGTNWTSLNNSTFAATQFQALAVHPLDRNYTLGGTQDNGTLFLEPNGTTWISSDGGDGGNVVIDQNAVNTTNITAYHTYFNRTNTQIGYTRATSTVGNGDPNWVSFFGCQNGNSNNGIACTDSTLFYAPMVGGPGNPNTLYFGTNTLYRSANTGTTMTPASQVMPATISAIGISRQGDNVRIVGLTNGGIFATTTGANPLANITQAGMPTRFAARAVIDPNNVNTAYVTFTSYGLAAGAHVWKTTNLNAATPTWAIAGTGIPDVPVSAFAVDPANSANLYAGTDIGVYASTDGGANWSPINNGQLPRVAVFDMAIQPTNRVLRIATHGRGIWELDLNAAARRPIFDFDGDGKTDTAIWRSAPGEWWYQRSSDLAVRALQFGTATDVIAPADFTGDGKTDVAVFRPTTGQWFVLRSEDASFYGFTFGTNGDIPAPGDFDGDGKADIAVYRPSAGIWYILRSSDQQVTTVSFGAAADRPAVADFDGDGKADISVWKPGVGQWWRINSGNSSTTALQFGAVGDKPTQGDYTGDGKADIAVFRPSDSNWYVLRSENSSFFSFPFGTTGDVAAPGDFDGDGRFDAAVFRPSTSTWYVNQSTSGTLIRTFGTGGDRPVPNAFIP